MSGRDPLKSGATTTVATGPAHDAVHLLQGEHRTVDALFERAEDPGVLAERMEQRNRELGGTLPLARPRRGKALKSGEGGTLPRRRGA